MEKILITTNQKLMFDEYAFLIKKYSTSVTVSMASYDAEVLSLLKRDHYALVIIDMNINNVNSLELFLMLSGKSKSIKVLMVNVQPENDIIFELHRLGVNGLLSTKADKNEFMKAIAAMIEEGRYFSPVLAEIIFFYGLQPNMSAKHNALTTREMQIMIMLANGRRIKEIAEHIYLSDKTISTYKARIYQKMEFENKSELVGYLLDNNFL